MERLEHSWGAPKDRPPAAFVGMTREWFSQLQRFGAKSVEAAFTHVIGTHEFQWAGALPKILAFVVRDDREWREIMALDAPRIAAPEPSFEHEGRTTSEEIEFRARRVETFKRETGFGTSEPELFATKTEPAPASTEMVVSHALRNSCAARRARKLPTCSDNCARRDCDLRQREASRNGS